MVSDIGIVKKKG
jgi:hypothetical protein